jgi:hypothetical protein
MTTCFTLALESSAPLTGNNTCSGPSVLNTKKRQFTTVVPTSHRLSAKAYDLLIFGPAGRTNTRLYAILGVLTAMLILALLVIKRLYRKVKAKKSTSEAE